VIVVLKGPGTIIAAPSGEVRIDTEGTAVLSCAGSGDVLAGIIGSVVAATHARGQGDLVDATAAAVWLHGRAGRIAGSRGRPVTALEILDNLPEAISHARRGEGA
jgi:NAD(P)H-hydrate repair Nnr-like enzyme with NAD(P)H-hydrate dehydratase domain